MSTAMTVPHRVGRGLRAMLAALLLGSAHLAWAEESPLEQLLADQQYDQLQRAARAALEPGGKDEAQAAFVLGKAAHLGLGQQADLAQAEQYYQRAARLGHARALHNLGVMALDRRDRHSAIRYFESALERGLKVPTLYNLGRAHDLTKGSLLGTPAERQTLLKAAGYFEAAYAQAPEDGLISDIVRVRTTAWRIEPDEQDHRALMTWVNLGVEKDLGAVYQNYGAMLYYKGDEAGARPWFEKAQARGVPAAAYALGLMASRTGSQSQQALAYFVQAAQGGMTEAMGEVGQLLDERLGAADSQQYLAAALAQVDELTPLAQRAEVFWPPYAYRAARQRHQRMQAVAYNQAHVPVLPAGQPLVLQACFADVPGPAGLAMAGESLRVVATSDPRQDPLGLPADRERTYRTDQRGCVSSPARQAAWYRQRLGEGKTLFIVMHSRVLRLHYVQRAGQGTLVPVPDE